MPGRPPDIWPVNSADIRATIGPDAVVAGWCDLDEACHGDLVRKVAAGAEP